MHFGTTTKVNKSSQLLFFPPSFSSICGSINQIGFFVNRYTDASTYTYIQIFFLTRTPTYTHSLKEFSFFSLFSLFDPPPPFPAFSDTSLPLTAPLSYPVFLTFSRFFPPLFFLVILDIIDISPPFSPSQIFRDYFLFFVCFPFSYFLNPVRLQFAFTTTTTSPPLDPYFFFPSFISSSSIVVIINHHHHQSIIF